MARYIGTIETLSTTFTVGGTPTDPTDVNLYTTAPDGTVTTHAVGTLTHGGTGAYSLALPLTAAGIWSWRWAGTGTAEGSDEGSFYVDASFPALRLCTLEDVQTARRGLPAALDALIEAQIARASAAVHKFTGRQFLVDAAASDRYFPMSDSMTVLIDDLSAAPSAAVVYDEFGAVATTLTVATGIVLEPRNRKAWEPYTRVRLRPSIAVGGPGYDLKLTGKWGWPAVPEDVREATITTVVEWLKDGQGLTAQSPDPFEPGAPPSRGLPIKARDMLRLYRDFAVG